MGLSLSGIKVTNVLAKATGLTALALVAYDAHHFGREKAKENEIESKTDSLEDQYLNSMTLDSQSAIKNSVKKSLFRLNTDEVMSTPFSRAKGYIEGFGGMLVDNVVPLSLALGTMFGGLKGGGFKSGVSKFSALGLLAYGGLYLLSDGLGVLKKND